MARIETWFEQDLQKPIIVRYLGGNVFSQDNMGNLIGVVLTNNGEDYSGGGTVSGNVIRNDGGTVALTGTITGNRAYVILPQAAYAVVGTVTIIIKLTVGSEVATIAAVVSDVYASSTDVVIDPGMIIPSIANLIDQIQEAVASIPPDWTKLKNAVAAEGGSTEVANWIEGKYYTASSSTTSQVPGQPDGTSSNFACAYSECSAGDVYHITAKGGSSGRCWVFLDSSNNIIGREGSDLSSGGIDKEIVAPAGAACVLFNADVRQPYRVTKGGYIINKVNKLAKNIREHGELDDVMVCDGWQFGHYNFNGSATHVDISKMATVSNTSVWQIIQVNPGDIFLYTGTAANTWRSYAILSDDSTANVLEVGSSSGENLQISVVYTDAKYLLVQANTTYAYSVIKFVNKHRILPGDDLDDFTEAGEYYCRNTEAASELSNIPDVSVLTGFVLRVQKDLSHPDYFIQYLIPTTNDLPYSYIFMRKHTTAFGNWITLWDGNQTLLDVKNLTLIPDGSDLDDYMEYGSYYCPRASSSATLDNLPFLIDGGFSLYVYNSGNPGLVDRYVRQVIFANKKEYSSIYTRTKNVEWGEWQLMTTAEMIHSPHILDTSTYVLPARLQGTPKKTIRVMTNNVAHYWMQGQDTDQYLADYPIKLYRWRKCLMHFNADIAFLQECEDYIDQNHQKKAFDYLYKPFFDQDQNIDYNWASRTDKVGRTDPSRRKILNRLGLDTETELVTIATTQSLPYDAFFNWCIVTLDGVGDLLLINAHNYNGTGAARIADRLNYLNKLAEFINGKTYDYLIIAGDWNTKETASDHPNLLNFCQNIDASPVNGGILGWFGTCTQEELPRTYDNIIVSNNIRIDDVDCDPMLTPSGQIHSDHTPVVAEISFM